MSSTHPSSISEQDIDALEEILFEDEFAEDALDYFGVHGLVCALVIGPVEIDNESFTKLIFADHEDISDRQLKDAEVVISKLRNNILATLSSGGAIDLPMYDAEEEYYEEALINWCSGFIEGFLDNESTWFERSQELVAELLLPIMSLSQLFDDEDFTEINSNPKIMEQFEEQLPELMTDLFLFFHSENK